MRPISHPRLFTLSAAFTVLALTASVLVQAYPAFAQQNSDANTPPNFTIGRTTINVLWSDYDEADVNIGSPFVATDAEGDDFSYSVREDNSDDYFQIDTSGQLKTTDNALPDPASSGGNKDEYSISVRVCKLGTVNYLPSRCDYIGVTINVIKSKAAIRYPVIAGHGGLEHPEGIEGVTTYTAFAPEDKNVGWVLSGLANDNDGDLFTIGQSDGVLRFKEAPDYDPAGDNSYDLTVSAYTGKNEQAWFNVKVTVVGDGNSPHFDGETDSRTVAENTAAGVDIGEPLTATDNDDSTLTYSLDGDDAASFDIDSTSGQLQTKAALDFETKASYTVTVLVSDGKNAAGDADTSTDDEITVTINVTDVNEAPTFDEAIPTRAIDENTVAGVDIGAPVAATDPDNGDTLTYTLGGADAASLDIVSTSGQLRTKAALDTETKASYTVTVSVIDDAGLDDEVTVTITVLDVNEAPTFDGETATRDIAENTMADQDIGDPVAASDPDNGDTLTYTLGGTDAASFGIVSTSGQLQTKAALDKETEDSYTVTVSVSDGKDASGAVDTTPDATITVTITVTDVNDAPSFDEETATRAIAENTGAGVDIGLPLTATDDDGDVLTYYLGASAAAFFYIVPTSGQLQTKVPLNHEATVRYSMRVSVRDSKDAGGDADTDADDEITVNITVTDVNEAPEFPAATDSRTVAENTGAGVAIGAPVAATDPDDGDTLIYTLEGTDAAFFDIDSTSGQLQTKAGLDKEAKASYTVVVSVSDAAGLDDEITVTINVTNVNEAPAFPAATDSRTVAENTVAGEAIGLPVEATDLDDGDTLTYTLGGTDAASFDIVSTSGQLQTKAALDKETKASYTVTVSVSDAAGLDDEVTVTITVTDVNDAPSFDGETTTRDIAENSEASEAIGDPVAATDDDGDTLTYALGGTDAGLFSLDTGTGQIQVGSGTTLDHETTPSYTVTVSVRDSKDADGAADTDADDEITVTINVTDANDAPSFDGETATRAIAENSEAGEDIGLPVAAADDDGDTLTYSLDVTAAEVFYIVPTSGQLQTKAALDKETKASYTVTVSVRDSKDASGVADAVTDDTITVTITVTDVNDAPSFDGETATRDIAENTGAGQNIGDPVAATDDDGDTLTYALGGTDAGLFSLDTGTGQIKVGEGTTLDHETTPSYTVTVSVRDSKDATGNADTVTDATVTVTITVTGVNEAPTFDEEMPTRDIAENTGAGQNIGDPVAATDQDNGDTLIYTLGGTDAASFDIVSTSGQLRTKEPLDKETKASYTVMVSVRDSKDATGAADTVTDATATVTITVTNVNEAPTFGGEKSTRTIAKNTVEGKAIPTRAIDENTAADELIGDPITATDPEGDPLTYTLGGTDAASFDIVDDTGQLLTKVALDHETKDSYTVTVSVSDGKDANGDPDDMAPDDTTSVTINITDVNEAPTFDEDMPTRDIAENTGDGQNIGAPVEATDPDDGDTLTYTLDATSAATFDIDGTSGQLKTKSLLDHESDDSYTVTVTATDSSSLFAAITVTIAVTDVNEAPVFASETAAREIPENTGAGVAIGDPVAAADPDNGDTLTYTLDVLSDLLFSVDNEGQIVVDAGVTLDYETTKSYTVTVSVSDGKDADGNSDAATDDTITVTIDVTDVNEAPEFASETAMGSIAENTAVGGNVGASITATDPDDGDTLTYTLDTTSAATFDIDGVGQLQTKVALDHDTTPSYTVTVSVRDSKDANGDADSAPDDTITVTITVTDVNAAPEYAGGTDTRSIDENTAAGEDIGAPVAATDDDDATLVYILGGTDARFFTIVEGTGQLQTKAALNHETKDSYTVTVSVRDNKNAVGGADTTTDATITVTITVTDVNEKPQFASETGRRSIAESTAGGGDVGGPITATDPDDGDAPTYTLGGTDVASFTIVEETGQIQLGAGTTLNYGATPSYTVTVTATDSSGLFDIITVTIAVLNPAPPPVRPSGGGGGGGGGGAPPNRRPAFTEDAPTTRSIAENTPAEANIGDPVAATDRNSGDTLVYSLRGTDAASFDIDTATGQLLTKVALDYETKASYSVIVRVSDGEDQDHITVAISVTNEDEAGTVTLSSSGPEVGVALTATLTDPDGGVTSVIWVWARSSDLSAWTAIGGAASNSYTPVDADKGGYLRVTASYADEHGLGKSAQATSAALPSNTAPRFPGVGRDANGGWNGGIERNVAENTAEGEPVGEPVVAMDPEDGALTCVLGGADAAMFTIEPDTGQIRVGAGTELDYEGERNVYSVAVIATDSLGLSATVPVVIRVTDVDLGPYDVNKNEVMERSEALAAVVDYFAGRITKEEAIGVVQLYFAS